MVRFIYSPFKEHCWDIIMPLSSRQPSQIPTWSPAFSPAVNMYKFLLP